MAPSAWPDLVDRMFGMPNFRERSEREGLGRLLHYRQ